MDRAEATGLGVALAGHVALLAVLSMGLATVSKPPVLSEPMEVSIVEDVGLVSAAPAPSDVAPAPRLAEVEGPVEPEPPPPLAIPEPQPAPAPLPQPKVAQPAPTPPRRPVAQAQPPKAPPSRPKAEPQKTAKAAPAKAAPAKAAPAKAAPAKTAPANEAPAKAAQPTGRLKGILSGLSDSNSDSQSPAPKAKVVGAAVQASLAGEVRRQLKPHWNAPSGADAELLRTQVTVSLSRSGAILDIGAVQTSGQTPSNRSQVKLHQEQAVRAVRLAAPFRLPEEYYDAWKVIRPTFDRRLSQ